MSNANVIQFSDLVSKKLGGVLIAKLDTGLDDAGNTVVTADLGPLEVNLYTSQDDGCMVVQIDTPSLPEGEKPTLRVYLNDTTLYDSQTGSDDDDSPNLEGA